MSKSRPKRRCEKHPNGPVTPPDPMGMNDARAQSALAAIVAFEKVRPTDREDSVADLLCNLRHWCDRTGFNWDNELRRANNMYTDETSARRH